MRVETAIELAKWAVIGGVAFYTYRKMKFLPGAIQEKLKETLPPIVYEGGEAAIKLGEHAFNTVSAPLDTFGISPGYNSRGVANWERSLPWASDQNDPVSNNNLGVNFNYF